MSIDVVLFDIGGVFIGLDFSRAVARTAAAIGRPPDEVRRRLFGAGDPMSADRMRYMNAYECGQMDDAEFHRCVEAQLEAPMAFDEFKAAWNDIFLEPIHETLRLAEALHARGGVRLGILSNNNALHWSVLRPMLPLVGKLEHVFLSHEMGVKKPAPEAFHHVLERMAARPERTVFVDDLADNIVAAQAIGIKTVHAVNARAVREGLQGYGVLE